MTQSAAAPRLVDSIRPAIRDLPPSGIMEVATYGRARENVMPLWFGEGDLPTPAFICEAASRALAEGHTFYTYQRGLPPLRAALSRYLSDLYETPVNEDRITVTTSGMAGINMTMQALLGPGDALVTVTPVWPNVFAATRLAGATIRSVPTTWTGQERRLDVEQLFDACKADTRAIFINSPCNPTGWTCPAEDLRRILEFARERGIWIIADEVYGRFTFDPETGAPGKVAPSFLPIARPDDRLIVINTFSKNWCMTGWRVGWMVTPPDLSRILENLIQFSTSGTPAFLQYGALAALEEGDEFVSSVIERTAAARRIVCNRLSEVQRVQLAPPDGAFYLFFRVEDEPDSMALAKRLIDEAGVGLAPGVAFGKGGEGFLRLCFAGSHDYLNRAMDRLVPALQQGR